MQNNKNKNENKNKNLNNNPIKNKDPKQNQDASKNDMRGEFGETFDIERLKDQKNNSQKRNNNDLDPGKRHF
ncbi:hypothetical protein [Sporosarcina beigongshangi]|uniref:hypothetical protein n=1 Tax=Sporosarcina beigongshangi TaxID=2782538 RepID=UPI00193A57D7|nr:hypothetical protein [Sporosarcina beigongshangi]